MTDSPLGNEHQHNPEERPDLGQPATAGYGQQTPPGGPQDRSSQAMTVLALGIVGMVFCQALGPVAWVMGHKELKIIDASGSNEGRNEALVGMILGIVSTIILIFIVLAAGFFMVIFGAALLFNGDIMREIEYTAYDGIRFIFNR